MPETPSYLFDITTPIDFSVHTTASYWELIKRKHPEVSKLQKEIQNYLRSPDQIRQRKQDRAIYLFYRSLPPYHICVVVKRVTARVLW